MECGAAGVVGYSGGTDVRDGQQPGLKLDTLFYDTTNFLTLLPAHHPELLAIPVNDLPSPGPQQPTRSAAAVATDAHALGSRMEGGFAPQ